MADVLVFNGTEWLSLRGPAGADGAQGLPGADGAKGDTGPAGADGAAGEAGPKGDPGEQGPAGEKGDKGDAGSGVTIVGPLTEWPITVPVEAGDMFIVSDPVPVGTPASASGPALPGDGIVYDGTSYSNVGPIRGPVGPAGLPGEKGEQGLAGPAGSDGVDGADGAPGADGADGVSQEVYGPQANEPATPAKGAIWFQI